MLQDAFDGHPPVCIRAGYNGAVMFLQSKAGDLALPLGMLKATGFEDKTSFYENLKISTDPSTDNWPFLYMPRRVYPVSYLPFLFLALLISFLVTRRFVAAEPHFGGLTFFFLGAGFMLVETKGITEMGLILGNTWQVTAIVIAGVLVMAFLANCIVQWLEIRKSLFPYLLLLATLGFGWFVSVRGGFSASLAGRLAAIIVLTCPVLFSGIVFSTMLASQRGVSSIMAINLLGAMCGGVLEYNSMYFGFQSLYVVAMVAYALAFLAPHLMSRRVPLSISRGTQTTS